jgi:D-sedoheptulose 7-phosphate isomerase
MSSNSSFSPSAYLHHCWQEHTAVVATTLPLIEAPLLALVEKAVTVVQGKGKILFFGNGGSAADAQHLATELTVRFRHNRIPIPALALTTDTSALTAIGNDYDFTELFARQIEALCTPQDMVIGISTSGNSENVLKALHKAHTLGAITAAFTGGTGGKLTQADYVDLTLCVPSTTTARIQEMHITIGQIFCGALEQALGLVPLDIITA